MVFKRPSRSLEGEKGEFNSHRKTKVGNKKRKDKKKERPRRGERRKHIEGCAIKKEKTKSH